MWRKRFQVLLLMAGWFAIGWLARGLIAPPVNSELALIAQAGDIISTQAYGRLPTPRQMTHAAIRGMLDSLDDKYAVFFDPTAATRDQLELSGQDAVIGLRGEVRDGGFAVDDVLPGKPAEAAGLKAGDVIAEVDDWTIKSDSPYSEVTAMIRGPIGTAAHLVVQRGDQRLNLDVPRTPAQDVMTRTLDGHLAYLRLDRFTESSPRQVEVALQQLLSTQPRALIWDLRYNGGGLMDSTQRILDLFLDDGLAFYARTRDGQLIPYRTSTGDLAEKIPMVVLIGPHTFSAPETAAASLADRSRAQLVGQKTYGKGSIVTTLKLADGSAMRLTVARWLSPISQTSYEGQGVSPNILVDENQSQSAAQDPVLRRAVEYLKQLQR